MPFIAEVEKFIETTIQNHWAATRVDYDNVDFKRNIDEAFIRLQIEWDDSDVVGIVRDRYHGMIVLGIFIPNNITSRLAATYADDLISLFNSVTLIDKFHIFPARVRRVGNTLGMYQRNLYIPFYYDYCK